MTTNNDYILARWRDAILEPPVEGWTGKMDAADVRFALFCGGGEWVDVESDERFYPVHGDQWLDVTTIPGVPREAVQAAVMEMRGQPPFGCDTWEVALDILQAHCGVEITPTEAQ